jgi:regulation of enolase protein 1 (concanavalin A-like superfamily)
MFADPQGEVPVLNAPRLLGTAEGDFQISTRVTVEFAASFDAGVLMVWVDEHHWAKLCFEYSPQGRPMIVSVVTRGRSDDANAFVLETHEVWLRVARLGPVFAFHASRDGHTWEMIRYFTLDSGEAAAVGFLAQSPTGSGCTATFNEIRYVPERLQDLRGGG